MERAAGQPARFNLTADELAARRKWAGATRRSIEGMLETLRTATAAPANPVEAKARGHAAAWGAGWRGLSHLECGPQRPAACPWLHGCCCCVQARGAWPPSCPQPPAPPQVQKANESFLGDEQAKQQLIMRCARCGVAFASWAARASHAVASGQRRVSTAPLYTLCARPALTPLQAAGQRAGGH